ncbi:UNKNOWN [Stylonychia lemnae]|uniref:Uncharacterized protein n=1 Tax=Stylonychia lemnae TaxID=5949 RepID=A0A077ZXP1_STYLE|nr:UNKNOWN [Stylonychia lemnae]|eukprot:CDW74321.1 UNKNOWN [Stylonychia lemnae]
MGANSFKGSAIMSGATTKASYLIQNSAKGTIISNSESQFSGVSNQQKIIQQRNHRHFLSNEKPQFDITNRDRFQKSIFKTVCEQKKEFEFTDGPQFESSFEDSLNQSLNKSSDRDVQTTIKKEFVSNMNPHYLKRRDQMLNDYVWYAAYDDDLLNDNMLRNIKKCGDKTFPLEFQSLRIESFEIVFQEPNFIYLQKKHVKYSCLINYQNAQVLIKAFLISFQQLVDLCVIKNRNFLSLREPDEFDDNVVITQASDQELYEIQFPESGEPINYDMIFSLGKYDGLPIFAFSNKDKSYINGRPSMQPSFLKHIGNCQVNIEFISSIFRGLSESFPQFTVDYLLFYLYSKPGINQKLTIEELTTVRLQGLQDSFRQLEETKRQTLNKIIEQSSIDQNYFDMEHSLMKNKQRSDMKFNTNNKQNNQGKVQNLLNSLTKQEIVDPFQSNKFQSSATGGGRRFNQSISNGLKLFRSYQRSPMTISSQDQGVFVIHRQEEDLIKRIDFQEEYLDSLENDLSPQKNNFNYDINNNNGVQVNISNLLDENSVQSSSASKFPVFIEDLRFEYQDFSPQQQHQNQFQRYRRKFNVSSSQQNINLSNQLSQQNLGVRKVKRVPLKDIKNTVMSSLMKKNQAIENQTRKYNFHPLKRIQSGESSNNVSPIGKRRSFGDCSLSNLQIEECSNISDVSYGKNYLISSNKDQNYQINQQLFNNNFGVKGPAFRLQTQPSNTASYVCHTNSKNSLLQYKGDINKENNIKIVSDRSKNFHNSRGISSYHRAKTNLTATKNQLSATSGIKASTQTQKTETFINEIKSILDNMTTQKNLRY